MLFPFDIDDFIIIIFDNVLLEFIKLKPKGGRQ